jgi:hypothetical protein
LRFQFRALDAKSASDDRKRRPKRLAHADPQITERVYRRIAERAEHLRQTLEYASVPAPLGGVLLEALRNGAE